MPRILLVDDEPLTTSTLQTLIMDEIPDVEVFSVNSALRALELLERNVYDVVVTDVAMPRMSGLELLDRIKGQGSLCYVIVLTAYNSFDYAYKAAQYEDVRFMLKIESPHTILDAVRGGLEKIRQYYSRSEDNQRLQQYMQETLPLLRQTLLERLLLYGEPLPEREMLERCGIRIVPGRDTWLAVTGSIPSQDRQQETGFLVLSMLKDRGICADVWYNESSLVFLMQGSDPSLDMARTIQSPLDRMIEGAGSATGLSFVLSSVPVPWEHIGKCTAALAGFARSSLESSRILLKNPLADPAGGITMHDAMCWRKFMEQRSGPALMDAVKSALLREGYPRGRQSCGTLLLIGLRECFGSDALNRVSDHGLSAESVLLHAVYETPQAWLSAVSSLITALFSGRTNQRAGEWSDMLDRVNRYIQEHFSEPISLTQIAEKFSYNSSYLSRVYKQNMHEGLSEHIMRVRIEHACQMLRTSGISISSISEQCGFQTTKYFITAFKRVTGKTPKAWRDAFHGDTGSFSAE